MGRTEKVPIATLRLEILEAAVMTVMSMNSMMIIIDIGF